MMTRWAAAWAAAGLIASLAPLGTGAAAGDLEFYTGETLYAQCAARTGDADYATHSLRCAGYVLGVSDAQQAAQGAGARGRVCLPSTASANQVVANVAAYLQAHPEKRPLAAQDLVIEALSAAYPCR
jgi:hypothetical protein